jgi:TP901 family phage tail tape measure protein
LQVTATANFSQLKTQINELKAQMAEIQKMSMSGGGLNANALAKGTRDAMANFERMVLSSKAFSIETVKMASAVDNFGNSLAKGQLGMAKAWQTWRQEATGGSKMLTDLATRQTRLMKSTFIPDPNMQGYAKAITTTNASMKELGATAEYTKIRASALNSVMREVGTGMVNFGKNTQWAGRQLTVGLTMPLVMFGAAASKAYLDFDKQMTSMLKVYGAHAVVQSQQTLDTIEKSVTNLADKTARTLGIAMSDTVEIAKTFSAIGLEGQNLISATEATTRLMKLGDLQAGQAANSMVSLQNVFKLQANQVQDAVNFLNAAKHSTSTTMQDIIDAIPRVGPIIQQMGGTYKDFVTFIVAMKESGVPAAQGANAIKSMLASIIKPTAQARKDFQAMHIDLAGIVAKNQGNVMGMVQSLQSSLAALPESSRLKAIEELFGKFQFARVTALMNNLGTAGSQSAKVLELYGQSNEQLSKVASQELDVATNKTPAAQFQKMKATLQADLIPLGKSFLKAFTSIGNMIDKIVNGVRSVMHALGPIGKIIGNLFGKGLAGIIVMGPIIMLTGLFINLAGQLFKMANFARMFRDGWKDGGFKGALAGIHNYFEEVDLSILASNASADTFKETIMSTADSFKFLNAQVAILKSEMAYISGVNSTPVMPMATKGVWGMNPSMPPASNDKMGGFVRPHMYAGSNLRTDWSRMTQSEQMAYPSLFSMQQSRGANWLSGERGYLERGLSAQWTAAPKGVPELLNSTYGKAPAIYGGSTGISKESMMAPGITKLIATHNGIIDKTITEDATTTAQLQSIFGTERVRASQLDDETKAKLEKALDTVIFEESKFKENMINTLAQEQAIISQVESTGSRTSVNELQRRLKAGLQLAESERLPAIQAAWADFNRVLTAEALAAVENMKMRLTAQMAGMPIAGAAMLGAEEQATMALSAGRLGVSQLEAGVSMDASYLKGTIPMLADGGKVVGPGGPRDDKVPAMLSGGEFVIKASSVNKYGTGLLDAINNGYAIGGPVKLHEGGAPHWHNQAGEMEKLVRGHVGTSGFINMMPDSLNRSLMTTSKTGVSGQELINWFSKPEGYALMAQTGIKMGMAPEKVLADIDLFKTELLSKINPSEMYGGPYTHFESAIGDSAIESFVAKSGSPEVWGELKNVAHIRTYSELDAALKNPIYKQHLTSKRIATIKNRLAKYGEGKTAGLAVPESIAKARVTSYVGTKGGGGKGLYNFFNTGKKLTNKLGTSELASAERLAMVEREAMMGPEGMMMAMMMGMGPKLANGGHIPAMLSNGEYVMSPGATAAYGKDFMSGINNGTAKFANGGGVRHFDGGGFSAFGALGRAVKMTPGAQVYQNLNREESRALEGMGSNVAQTIVEVTNRAAAAVEQGGLGFSDALMAGANTAKEALLNKSTDLQIRIKNLGTSVSTTMEELPGNIRQGTTALKESVVNGIRDLEVQMKTSAANFREGAGAARGEVAEAGANPSGVGSVYVPNQVRGVTGAAGWASAKMGAGWEGYKNFRGVFNEEGERVGTKMFKGGMGSMMGGMVLGQGMQAIAGNMQDGAGKAAMGDAAMGAQFGGMFGPEGMVAGMALGATFGALKHGLDEFNKNLADSANSVKASSQLSSDALSGLGVSLRSISDIQLPGLPTSSGSGTSTASGSTTNKPSALYTSGGILTHAGDVFVNSQAARYASATDDTTKSLIGTISNQKDKQTELVTLESQYNAFQATGASKEKSKAMLTALLRSTKLSEKDQNQLLSSTLKGYIPKGNDNSIFGSDDVYSQYTKGQKSALGQQIALGVGQTLNSSKLGSGGNTATGTSIENGQVVGTTDSWFDFGGQGKKVGNTVVTNAVNALTQAVLTNKGKDLTTQVSGITGKAKEILNTTSAYNKLISSVGKSNSILASYLKSMQKGGATTTGATQVIGLLSQKFKGLASDGNTSAAAIKLAAQQMAIMGNSATVLGQRMLAGANILLGMQQKTASLSSSGDLLTKAQGIDAAKDAAKQAGGTGGGGATGPSKAETNLKNKIQAQQDYVKGIQDEMSARQKLFDAQQKNIDQQKTLADLQNNITKAGASGDLIAMAQAQSDYNTELSKQQQINAKDKADAADQKKIDAANAKMEEYQKELTKLQEKAATAAQKTAGAISAVGTNSTASTDATKHLLDVIGNFAQNSGYKNLSEFTTGLNKDKDFKTYLEKSGLSAKDLTTYLGDVYNKNQDAGKFNAGLESSAGSMKGLTDQTTKLAVVHSALMLILGDQEKYKQGKTYNFSKAIEEAAAQLKVPGVSKANGGIIFASSGIGPVVGPGGPKADIIPAMLSNGEYVVQASSVAKYGIPMMDAINAGTYGPKYATGGIIKSYSVGSTGGVKSDSTLPAHQYNVNIVVNGANADASQIADMVATRFRREAESMGSGRSFSA